LIFGISFTPSNGWHFQTVHRSAFALLLILLTGGHGLLNPSPASLPVASMPIFVPIAISDVAWSKTSAGPLVKRLFRLRQGFGGQARCGLAVP